LTSAVCEEFSCPPDVADRQDVARCTRIMELRRYRDAHQLIARGTKQEDLPDTPMVEKAKLVQIAKVQEALRGR